MLMSIVKSLAVILCYKNLSLKKLCCYRWYTAQTMKFQLRMSSVNLQFPAGLFTFTEEILNGKLHFLCSDIYLIITVAMHLPK